MKMVTMIIKMTNMMKMLKHDEYDEDARCYFQDDHIHIHHYDEDAQTR